MATMNLAIRGIDADLGDHNADTFFEDLHKTEKFDFILANPPFNLKDWEERNSRTTYAGSTAPHRRATPTSHGSST